MLSRLRTDKSPMKPRPLAWLCLPVLLAAVAAGCGGSSSSSPKSGPKPVSSASADWKVYSPAGSGYKIEIHAGWVTIDAASLANSSGMRALAAKNPQLSGALSGFAQMAKQPGVLVAFDRTSAGKQVASRTGFAPNIIVRRIPLGSPASDSALLDTVLNRGRINASRIPTAIGSPTVSRLTIAGLPGGVVTYRITENTLTGSAKITERDYVTVRSGTAYTVYCSSTTTDIARIQLDCDHALSSLTFTD
jgi:hypothetical protein